MTCRSILLLLLFSSYSCLYPLTYVFSHGFGSSPFMALGFSQCSLKDVCISSGWKCDKEYEDITFDNALDVLRTPLIAVKYPYTKLSIGKKAISDLNLAARISKKCVTFGQAPDLEALRKAIQMANDEVVLLGHSLGASTIINYLSTYGCVGIKAVILIAPFDDIKRVFKEKAGAFSWTGIGSLVRKIMFPAYNSQGISPLSGIASWKSTKNWCPILFAHSKEDELVSHECSHALYDMLSNRGHKHLYMMTGSHSSHGAFDPEEQDVFMKLVHAFYKRYGIPYDEDLAQAGASIIPGSSEFSTNIGSVKIESSFIK